MKRISSFLLVFLLLTISTVGWAACPEGQEENDRTGECVSKLGSFGGSKSIDQENREIIEVVSSNSYNIFSLINNPTAGGTVTIKAKLEFPSTAGKTEKIPAMVFVHGSGGPLPRHQKWLKLFREMGIASVYANHFKSRGVRETAGKQLRVTSTMLVADALHLLNALAKHPRIDPNRIGIMGASKGGSVAWWVTWNPLREVIAKDKQFAASIPLYPACAYWEKKDFTNKPMLMMIGDKDNYTGVDQCVSSMKEIRSAGYSNMQVKLYKGAYHGFDTDRGIRKFSKGYNLTKCKFVVRADGKVIEMNSGFGTDTPDTRKKMFSGCASKGVTLGGNHVMPQAMQDVREFLTAALAPVKKTVAETTASTSGSDLIWCGHKKEVSWVDRYSCEWLKGGEVFDTQWEAIAFHKRLKGSSTSTASSSGSDFVWCLYIGGKATKGSGTTIPRVLFEERKNCSGKEYDDRTQAKSELNRLKGASTSTSGSNLIWCGTKKEVTRVDQYSCEWLKGGRIFDTQWEATRFHKRLKGEFTSTVSTTQTTSTSTAKAEAPLSKEPLAVPTTPEYLVVDVQAFLKVNPTLPELVVVMQQTLALKAAIKREDQARIEDSHDQLVGKMAEIEGFTAFQQARAKQRHAGAAILKKGKAVALELRQYLVEHMEADNIGQLLTTLAALEAALGQGDIETVQRLIDTASTAINATATPSN